MTGSTAQRFRQIGSTCGAIVLIALTAGCDSNNSNESPSFVQNSATAENLREHVKVLAADDMQGREAGANGHQKAADYVATQFSELGLQPLGTENSFFQTIQFIESTIMDGSSSMTLHQQGVDIELKHGEHFARSGGFGGVGETITAPLAFVGFGIQAPEYNHDDFADIDVEGKLLVVLSGAPPLFAADERAYYSSSTAKQSLVARMGGVGILAIRTPVDQARLPWTRVLNSMSRAGMRWLDSDGAADEGFPTLSGSAALSESGAELLFELVGKDLDELFRRHSDGETGSLDLDISATLNRRSKQLRKSSPNVIALLPGTDPELRAEHVLFTAHLDHLGFSDQEIFNGAYDNATGVATMIEVAAAFVKQQPAPKRSIIFAAVTAEEKGLRGSDYLANHPPVPIGRIVANINIDMPYLGYPLADIEGFGVEHSSLHGALISAADSLGLKVTPDSRPDLVRLIRSDQFSFVKQGVPGLNLKPGTQSSDPSVDGTALRNRFLSEHYHQASDDLHLEFDEQGAKQFLNVAVAFGLIVANDDKAPVWKEGDFFGDRFSDNR